MRTVSPKERTADGIGVGSLRGAVGAKVPAAKCLIEYGYNHCYVRTWTGPHDHRLLDPERTRRPHHDRYVID